MTAAHTNFDSSAPTGEGSHRRDLLITAGPTHEPIDQVRYLGNRSSGRLGIALSEAAIARGWSTTLLLGPTHLPAPDDSRLRVRRFRTTADLRNLLHEEWPAHRTLIMAAAVADYRPTDGRMDGKMSRGTESIQLNLEPTPDLLSELAATRQPDQYVVGFALEPRAHLDGNARGKLARKHLDAIVANPLETMEAESIAGRIYFKDGSSHAPDQRLTKSQFAAWLLDRLAEPITARP